MPPLSSPGPARLRILWIRAGGCLPLTSGGVIYSYHLLMHLVKHCHVHALELRREGEETSDSVPYAHELECVHARLLGDWSPRRFLHYIGPVLRNLFASRRPFIHAFFENAEFKQRVRERVLSGQFDLVIADELVVAPAFEGWKAERRVPSILLQHNVEASIWKRMTQLQRNPFMWLFYQEMTRRMRLQEPQLCQLFDAVLTNSTYDADCYREVFHLPHVLGSILPGTPPSQSEPPPAVLQQQPAPWIAFVGAMNWPPNTDAAIWFMQEVLPLIRKTRPDVRFRVIGHKPPPSFYHLAASHTGIEITGTVPAVLPLLRECTVQVVPLRAGSGVRHKILESMGAGVPVVSTTIGAEGLYLEDERELLLADDAPALSAAILRLLDDPALRKTIAENAFARINRDFLWEHSGDKLLQFCHTVLQKKHVRA